MYLFLGFAIFTDVCDGCSIVAPNTFDFYSGGWLILIDPPTPGLYTVSWTVDCTSVPFGVDSRVYLLDDVSLVRKT